MSFNFARFLTSVSLPEMSEPEHEDGEKVGTEGIQARCRHDRVGLTEWSGGGRGGRVGRGRSRRIKEDLRWPPPAVSRTLVAPTGPGSTTPWGTVSVSILCKQLRLFTNVLISS